MITFLRNQMTRNLGLKAIAFALAVLIWFIVHFAGGKELTGGGQPTLRTYYALPVTAVAADADVRAFRVNPARGDVTVRGAPAVLDKLLDSDLRITVDLTGIPARQSLRRPAQVSVPMGVTLVRVTPPEVEVIAPQKR